MSCSNASKSSTSKSSNFSCDLVEGAKLHRLFLQTLHQHDITTKRPNVESLRRYSKLWLPLIHHNYLDTKNATGNLERRRLIPPPDVAWMWHCHRLAPYRYAKHIRETYFQGYQKGDTKSEGMLILDADLPFSVQLDGNLENPTLADHNDCAYTLQLWTDMYPQESFFLNETVESVERAETNLCLTGFDILGSCERQATFLWQVSGERFRCDHFLQEGVQNYYNFVSLMGTALSDGSSPKFLVPTYQIDLIWHTHILSSFALYHADCMRINGRTLEHDDSLNDRVEGGTLDVNFRATTELWKQIYGVEYKIEGGMYRGEPPDGYYNPEWAIHSKDGTYQPIPADLPYAHLIGIVGASSTGVLPKNESEKVGWKSIDQPDMFLPANPKSTDRRTNANEEKKFYFFGKGDKGWGYYHFHTREAYNVMTTRIDSHIKIEQGKQRGMRCMTVCTCCLCLPCLCHGIKKKGKAIAELKDLKIVVEGRLRSAGPVSDVDLPDALRERFRGRNKGTTDNYYCDPSYIAYNGGGGCGMGLYTTNGGGGGDGGDGGGGCGGGGCGGGGCGGGGCGGGGGG